MTYPVQMQELTMPATYYPAVVDRSTSDFGVSFPDFLGLTANGRTISEACARAELALAFHIDAMTKDKDAIPEPSSIDDIEPVDGANDVAFVMVRAEVAPKITRVLVSMDENLLRSIDAFAPNRSAFLAEAARARLDGITAAAIIGQGELATKGFADIDRHIEARFGLSVNADA
jgi:predicted RNase H-like HicB family nuclease